MAAAGLSVEQRFEMPWDLALKVSTGAFVLLLLSLGAFIPWLALHAAQGDAGGLPVVLLVPSLAIVLVLPVTWALAPRALGLGGGLLRIERSLRPVEVPLAEVRAVGRLPREAVRGLVRTWGSGGAFGHYGRYWSRRLGAIRLYATRRDGYVVVDTDRGRYLVTPGDPEAFTAALLRAAPRARPVSSPEALEPAPGALFGWKGVAVAAALVGLLVGVLFLLLWAWAPRSVRLYAPRAGPHWLVETPEGKVVVVPDDPAALEAAARARGGGVERAR